MSNQYDNSGRGALWNGRSYDKGGPRFTGNFVADRDIKAGEKIPVKVWDNDEKYRQNPNAPILRLEVDRWEPGTFKAKGHSAEARQHAPVEARTPAQAEEFNDDIPF